MTHTTENSKEVLHTQGVWVAQNWVSDGKQDYPQEIRVSGWPHGKLVAKICFDKKDSFGHDIVYKDGELKANAELICKAVNERQKLLDSNRELIEALVLYAEYEKEHHGDMPVFMREVTRKIKDAIQKNDPLTASEFFEGIR